MIHLKFDTDEVLVVPPHRLNAVRRHQTSGRRTWYVELTGEDHPRYCQEEPAVREQIPAGTGFYGLLPIEAEDGVTEWLQAPIVAWHIDRGLVTGQEFGVLPVFAPAGAVIPEEHKQLVLVDFNSKQACLLADPLWRPNLVDVMANSLGVDKVDLVDSRVTPWEGELANLRTRKA